MRFSLTVNSIYGHRALLQVAYVVGECFQQFVHPDTSLAHHRLFAAMYTSMTALLLMLTTNAEQSSVNRMLHMKQPCRHRRTHVVLHSTG